MFLLWQTAGAGATEILNLTLLTTDQILIVAGLIRQVVGLILVLIVIAALVIMGTMGGQINNIFNRISNELTLGT